MNCQNMNKTIRYLQKNGLKHTWYAARERIEEKRKTIYAYEPPIQSLLEQQREEGHHLPYHFSIIVPAYETQETFLRELIDSVRAQSYEKWELLIADASLSGRVEAVVASYQEKEKRIRYLELEENKGISENTNAGIMAAEGDYIGLLDHDDVLTPDALYEMAIAIYAGEQRGKTPVLLYSDEDKMETGSAKEKDGNVPYRFFAPNRKSKFNLDLILSNNYICHFMVTEASLMKRLKLRKGYDGAQDYDFVLRVVDGLLSASPSDSVSMQGREEQIVHVPKVLYHWRCHELSTADNTASKAYAYEAGKAALEDFYRKRRWKVKVAHALHLGFYRTEYASDIFRIRQDIGIIGGRVLDRHNRIKTGIYDEEGTRLYQGLHKEYSGGSTHTASLMQDCGAVDIRCIRVRDELRPVFAQIVGIAYREIGERKLADVSGISCDEEGYRKLSMELGAAAAAMGYLVVWDPQITVRQD